MRYLKMLVFALLPVVMLALGGCGGGSSSTTQDPFGSKTSVNPPNNPVFPNISTATGKMTLSLTTDVPSVDVDNGQVLAIAKVKVGEEPVVGIAVTFSVLAPTDLVTVENATVLTDSTGTAVTRMTAGHTASTTNVLFQASIKVGTQSVRTTGGFQIIRGGGVIMFSPAAGIKPEGQNNIYSDMSATVLLPPGGIAPGSRYTFAELLPFKLTDSNRNARVGVPVTISVYSINSMRPDDIVVDFLVPPVTEPNQTTITTDNAGQGIYNLEAGVLIPNMDDGVNTVNVVFKAVTHDPIPVIAYVGCQYTVKTKARPLTQTASMTAFGDATEIVIPVGGGLMPYSVKSSNPSRVTATLVSGTTVVAHLVDTSDWSGSVIITITDSTGQTTAVGLTRK